MRNSKPRVSIGLPVFNGEDFIAAALDAILAQTYTDFELIISDNGSTDGTQEICRAYAAKDQRIRYYHSEQNLGAAWNYNRVFQLSSGEYFKWAAHDDACAPTFVERCVDVLDRNPSVVLCFTWLVDIDAQGNQMEIRKSNVRSDSARPHERFWGLAEFRPANTCEAIFGLIRASVLNRTRLIGSYTDSDRTLLAELGLHGPFYQIPEALFLHRQHANRSVAVHPEWQDRVVWFDPAATGRIVLPNWRQLAELLSAIWRSPVSWKERLYCYVHMLTWLKKGRRRLRRDLVWGAKHITKSVFQGMNYELG